MADQYDSGSEGDLDSSMSDLNLDNGADLAHLGEDPSMAPHRGQSSQNAMAQDKNDMDRCNPAKSTKSRRGDKAKPPSKYHETETVFPGMKIPVYMRHRPRKHRGQHQEPVDPYAVTPLPVMSIQCPLPGGTVSTLTTDPVERVSWGPITRVEASKQARDLVKEWLKAKDEDSAAEDVAGENEPRCDKAKTPRQGDKSTTTEDAASLADTEITNITARVLRPPPPPPTPPESASHHSLSMPTLPELHRVSDVNLVEQYRLQHAANPEAFKKETREIKQSLINAKVARGGISRLLTNEYTVELASREDAEKAQSYVRAESVDGRSRTNTSTSYSPLNEEQVNIRGGETESGTFDNGGNVVNSVKLTQTPRGFFILPTFRRPQQAGDQVEPGVAQEEKCKDSHVNSRQELRGRLKALDLSAHASKATTYGSVRHQHSVKREVDEFGEKRTVKTWIEITEVYEVPSTRGLRLRDLVTAVEEESSDEEGESDEDREKRRKKKSKLLNQLKKGKGEARRSKQSKHVMEQASSDSDAGDEESESESESESDDSSSQVFHDPDETSTEALLRSLSQMGNVSNASIDNMRSRLSGIITSLGGNGQLTAEDEE